MKLNRKVKILLCIMISTVILLAGVYFIKAKENVEEI